jgi:hypothetical protein
MFFFLLRRLPFNRPTDLRPPIVRRALDAPRTGDVVDRLLNKIILPIMPQHIVVAKRTAHS